ncbi:MAG: helix-turn-helix domain-containing protein [Nannocystaceae bacterium]|nr:AraC family transcriptional regulator [bacterium]
MRWLDALETTGRWFEATLAGALGRTQLSRSRFLHLFSEEVGSPWRTYLVWRRAQVAMSAASTGTSLTEAAHFAGYADLAHFSRQFVALFGVPPGQLVKASHFVQAF